MAAFERSQLVRCAYVSNPVEKGANPRACAEMARAILAWCGEYPQCVVIEWPQIYPRSPIDPNDLPGLAGIGSALAMAVPVKAYLPREWKGQLPKQVHHRRVLGKLSAEEIKVKDAGMPYNKDHKLDVWDAIALGITHTGRLPLP